MKKAQIQFMETIFILFVIIILIFIAIFFYYFFFYKGIQTKGEKFSQVDAIILSDSITSLPEFNCGPNEVNCLDTTNIFAFKTMLSNNPDYKKHYQDFFKNKNINLFIKYPEVSGLIGKTPCSRSNYPVCNYFEIYKSPQQLANKEIYEIPVSVYFPQYTTGSTTPMYKIGILNIEVLKK